MGFFDFFKKIGKAIAKGARNVVRFVGKVSPFIQRIARGVRKATTILSAIPGLTGPALLISEIAGKIEQGAEIAGRIAGGLQDIDEQIGGRQR